MCHKPFYEMGKRNWEKVLQFPRVKNWYPERKLWNCENMPYKLTHKNLTGQEVRKHYQD